ncbi:hypothetical protein ACFSHR_26405 [Azotobacter chroococcum]
MSFVGDLAFDDQRALEQDALENPALSPPEPSFWDGSGSALLSGITQGQPNLRCRPPSTATILPKPS